MAKGRRLTPSRSDRPLGSYGSYGHDHENLSEFGEEDLWSTVEDTSDHHQRGWYGGSGNGWHPRAAAESGRRCEVDERLVGGLSLAFEDMTMTSSNRQQRIIHQFGGGGDPRPRAGRHMATSAPVNVPDWSKILRVNSVESIHDSDEDDRVGDSGIEPPHQYLARSRKMNAMSVCEGVGRTLKGRDMSRVRDAVWSQTGFEG